MQPFPEPVAAGKEAEENRAARGEGLAARRRNRKDRILDHRRVVLPEGNGRRSSSPPRR